MNSIIYYNNKYPQDYGILYMDTPESDLLSIDKLTDYKKGIRMYGLISCIGVFILPNPNTLIGGHFVDERDIDFLTKMDNIIMNDCSAASAKSGDLEEAASCGGDCNPHIIYKWYPLQIYKYNDNNSIELIKTINTPKIFSECRGSTCGVKVKTEISKIPPGGRGLMDSDHSGVSEGEWVFVEQKYTTEIWFVLHIVSCETPRHYYHIIAVFDVNMTLIRYSAPFKFEESSIEYCLSILVEEERVLINYSTWDRTTRIGVYGRKYIESLLKYI